MYKSLASPFTLHCSPSCLAMQVLPYLLLLLLLLPQSQGCKNIKAQILRRAGYQFTAQSIFEKPEVQKILLQIIRKKFGVTVNKEDIIKNLVKVLTKKEIKYDQKIM